jgi:dCMP deaminase
MSNFSDEKAAKFMRIALSQAFEFSKDDSTRVAAMIIGRQSHEIRSSGYNGMPRGCNDNLIHRQVRPEKYFWYEHAERNAIYNAARVGTQLAGSLLLVTMYPCMDCARAIVQSGIEEVVTVSPPQDFLDRWGAHVDKSAELFGECGVKIRVLSPDFVVETGPKVAQDLYRSILSGNSGYQK